jgi:hypothetical protein
MVWNNDTLDAVPYTSGDIQYFVFWIVVILVAFVLTKKWWRL